MRSWTTANGRTGSEWCGGCGQPVRNGEPMQRIVLTGLPERRRGQCCAVGAPDWGEIESERQGRQERERSSAGFQPLANAGRRFADRFDPKLAAAGKDE